MRDVISLFEEYYEKKDLIEISIDKMKEELEPYINKIVLYGAGSAGIAFYNYLKDAGIEVKCFADGDSEKWGKKCEGIEIINYRDIVYRVGKDALVIVTINTDGVNYCKSFKEELKKGGHQEVHNQLHDAGCENVVDYAYFRKVKQLYEGDRYNLFGCSDVLLMQRKISLIEEAYSYLEDDTSREIFVKLLRYRLLNENVNIPCLSEQNRYFEYLFWEHNNKESFVDCGAFNGNSLQQLIKTCGSFNYYYGYEVDEDNYKELLAYIDTLDEKYKTKCTVFNSAVWDLNGTTTCYKLSGPGSFAHPLGESIVRTITIDDSVQRDVSYIKMNIEGSEIRAIRGAKNTIMATHPHMMLAGYHKTKDMWEIPLLVKSYVPEYKINLRTYMGTIDFYYCFS